MLLLIWYYKFAKTYLKIQVGIMLAIVIMPLQDEGKMLLEEVLGSNKTLNNMCQVFQI
jgi:hypothetical protein